MAYYGIDVSYHQGDINWPRAAAGCIRFAFVRAGYSNGDGTVVTDTRFARNTAGATAAGLDTGLYLYTYARTPEASRDSANWLVQAAGPYLLTMPLVLDIENTNIYPALGRELSTDIALAFLQTVQDAGYYPMLYTNTYFADTYLDMERLSAFDFWVADYTEWVGYQGPFGIWQYTDRGVIDGVPTRVDLDIAYQDYPAIIRSGGWNHLPPAPGGEITVGSRVCIRAAARCYARPRRPIPQFDKLCVYTVQALSGGYALLGNHSWIALGDLCLARESAR